MVQENGIMATEKRTPVLTPPLSLDGGLAVEHRTPNLIQRLLSLFRSVRRGSDLTHFQLPALFNMPKSQLQCYGEGVYCIGEDLLSRCSKGKSSLERFTSVLAWSISTTRPPIFGMAPYNPILGETHHVSKGTLNVLLEQVSHHPPVAALHATDATQNMEILWWQLPVPKFNGSNIETAIQGKRQLKLLGHGETYEMDTPNLVIKLLPVPGTNWAGNVRIRCKESGLEAELCYHKSRSFLGLRGNSRSVKGTVFYSKTLDTIYEISGHWDRIVTLKDVRSGKSLALYNAKDAISGLKMPVVKDPEGLLATESTLVWSEVSRSLLEREWEKARDEKKKIEERERELAMTEERMSWVPKYFTVSRTKEGGWECSPKNPSVPPAPIIVS